MYLDVRNQCSGPVEYLKDPLGKEGHSEDSNCCRPPADLLLLPSVSWLRHPTLVCAAVSLWLADGE